jgi:signal transduction histidine kinase
MAVSNAGKYQLEYRVILPDGTNRWIGSSSLIETDATGKPVLICGIAREITAHKRAEQERQLLQREIAHVGRVSMMGQLASALAHEIKQPLTAILLNAQAAERLLQHPSPNLDEIRAIICDIRSDDQRAGAVIHRMQQLLKRNALDTLRIDVGTVAGDVIALVRTDAVTRRVNLDIDLPGDLRLVRGDRVPLQQVLLNLILNSMDALQATNSQDRRVSVSARNEGTKSVEIIVRDTGPGIPAALLAKVFDPIFTTKAHGMGMGLAISRTIVEAHGGRIWAENQSGGGAAFHFTVPVA